MSKHLRTVALLALSSSLLGACKDDAKKDQGAPPPPPPSASASAGGTSLCEPSNVGIADAKVAALMPPSIAGFCVLKGEPPRSWGEGTGKKIDDISDIIDGAGEIYAKNYLAKRYDSLRYVDARGTDAAIDIALSTFDKPENAYALFTYRLVANADPDPEAMKKAKRRPWQKLAGGGAAALGNAAALLWKGNYLVELTYTPDVNKTEAEATKTGDELLPKFVAAIGDKIVGTVDLPADVMVLPKENQGRIALGIEYVPPKWVRPEGKGDALKINVAGGYATGYMRDGDRRYRVLAFARDDRDAARDVMSAFARLPGALPLKDKDFGDEAVHFAFPVGSGGAGAAGKAEGVAVRKGALVLAITDEELAMGDPESKGPFPRLSKEDKINKLRKLLDAPPPAPASSASGASSASSAPPPPK